MTHKRWTVTAEKFLSPEQLTELLAYLDAERKRAIYDKLGPQAVRDYYLVRILLETGVRNAEFCALVNEDLIGEKLVVRCGKGGKARTVLLTRASAHMLRDWMKAKRQLRMSLEPGAPLFPNKYNRKSSPRGIHGRIKQLLERAGMPTRFSPHSFRHSYATLLLAAGIPISRVRDNLGHSSIAVTDIYSGAIGDMSDITLLPKSGGNGRRKPGD